MIPQPPEWVPLVAQMVKRPGFKPWVRKMPWRREWLPTPVLLPGKFHGQRSLEGYSPQGWKESDMTGQLILSLWLSKEMPRWHSGAEFACSAGDAGNAGLIPGSGRSPGEGNDNWLQYSCLEKFHRQRSLVGHRPWDGQKDTTEQLRHKVSRDNLK